MSKTRKLSLKKILNLIQKEKEGSILLSRYSLENYKGMYEEYIIIYNNNKNTYHLMYNLICYVLDFFGDSSQDIRYEFSSVEKIINYVENKLSKKLEDMTIVDRSEIPTIFDITEEEKLIYEKIWWECRKDFDDGKFLDKTLKFIQ